MNEYRADHGDHREDYRNDYGHHRNYMGEYGDYRLLWIFPPSTDFIIEEFLDWLADVEQFFDYMEIQEYHKVKLVTLQLKRMHLFRIKSS